MPPTSETKTGIRLLEFGESINRRKFVRLAALASLVPSGAEIKGAPAGKPLLVLPDGARAYHIGQGDSELLAPPPEG